MRSRPRSNSSSSDGSLAKGNKVLIVATDNTLQRVPQYIGQVGIVKEAPVHPCTWFKIKFSDGEVFTFRPSALVGVSDDYNPETGEGIIYRNPSAKYSPPDKALFKLNGDKHILTPVKAHNPNPKWLSDLDGDLWVGARVRVTTGRMKSHEGVVLRSGNGWVQVETATFGEVAKRAHELELVSYDSSKVNVSMTRLLSNHSTSGVGVKRSHDTMDEGNSRTSSGRQVRPRALSDGEEGFTRGRGGNGRTHSYDGQGNLLTAPMEARPPSAPLIHPDIKEARNKYMQKYVKKMTEKLKHRPDLMYWTHMLKSSHVLSGGLPDPALESELARDFNDSVCTSCLKERWPAAKFCWNEACPASPVYYKLTKCSLPTKLITSTADVSTSNPKEEKSDSSGTNYTITITDDAVPGDARFNAYEHSRAVRSRMHMESPQASAVTNTFSALPSVIFPSKEPCIAYGSGEKADSSGMIIVETDKSSYKIPNSSHGRALLVQKLVREGLTDSTDRVCGDNWSVPDECNVESDSRPKAPGSTHLTISAVMTDNSSIPAEPQSVSQEKKRLNDGSGMDHFPLPGLQLSGLPRVQQQERPPLLPSILQTSNSEYRIPSPNTILDTTSSQANTIVNTSKAQPVSEGGGLLLSASTNNIGARISPYLARGPECFNFSGLSTEGAKSPTARVA